MKALSVKQPWAYLLCAGIKDVENRTWRLPEKHIGERILIHASADKKTSMIALTLEQHDNFIGRIDIRRLKPCDQWLRSAIIGSVRLVGCAINHDSIWAEKCDPVYSYKTGKIVEATYNWIVADPVLFENPILNVKGRLGFWESYYEPIVCSECEQIHCAQ